ncbi:hypothetical protein DH20_09900 [Pantoea agglomerans]|nr:hypothetical protein [Pantoea agglomerans]
MCLLLFFVVLLANGDNEYVVLSLFGDIYLVDFLMNAHPARFHVAQRRQFSLAVIRFCSAVVR